MTERVRRRTSKWDLKDDPENFPVGTREDSASFEKASGSIHNNGSKQEWNSPKNSGNRNSRWSDTNPNSAFRPETNLRRSGWEPPSGNRSEHRDDTVNRDFHEVSQNMKTWDGNRSYSGSMSPGLDCWRQRSRSRSPRRNWSKSLRSRSRSPPHGRRSRSRSPPRGLRSRSRTPPRGLRRSRTPPRGLRSRSRTPPRGLRREPEEYNDRIRGGSRLPLCNDFVRGKCMRGSQCRFLHEENSGYADGRHSDSLPSESWGSKHDRGSSYGHPNYVERDYARDKLSQGHVRNNRSSDLCINFLKGNCHRGSTCRFIHENSVVDGRGTSERLQERDTNTYSGHENRRESYRQNNIPCRYFASGNCRKGIDCRFSHDGAAHDRPQGGSANGRRGHNLGEENKSWGGPKWSDEAADSTHGSAEVRSQKYGPSSIEDGSRDDLGWNKKPRWNDDGVADGRLEARPADEMRGNDWHAENKARGGPKWGDEAENKSGGGPKWGDEVAGVANGSAGGSLSDRSGHIANSGWDDPTYKKFSGPTWNDKAVDDRPEEKSVVDETRGHSFAEENKSWGGPKQVEEAAEPPHGNVEARSMTDGMVQNANSGSDDPRWTNHPIGQTWNDAGADSGLRKLPPWKSDDNSGRVGDNDENKLLGGIKWTGNATDLEPTKMPDWRNDIDGKNIIPVSRPTQISLDDRRNFGLDDQNRTWGVPIWSDTPSDQDLHKLPSWISDNNSASVGVQLQRSQEGSLNFTTPAGTDRNHHPHFVGNERTGFGIQDPQSQSQISMLSYEQTGMREVPGHQHHPPITTYPDGHTHPAPVLLMHSAVSSMNPQNQHILLSPAPRALSFDLNGPVEEVSCPNHRTQLQMVEPVQQAGHIEPKMLPITSGASLPQNVVTSEQVAQISNLSASLAQIFGNSQQLPQLYATLNSANPMGLPSHPNPAGLGASVGGSLVQSHQDTWFQKQHDPVNSSIESSQISVQPPGVSEELVKRNGMADTESQIPLQSSALSSVAGGHNGSESALNGGLEKTLHHQSSELMPLDSVGKEKTVDPVVKAQDTGHPVNAHADDHLDEDGKRSKDTKGMRMFKFALVEFVKEILKPTWKEGQLSKEAHKAVVKRVIDKVTGSVQGDHIPQTQDKIDQYLAYSKAKLTKLVEAYVEKYLKS